MSDSNRRRNPRKRNASQMMMFKRALSALNKNDDNNINNNNRTNTSKTPPSKRARVAIDNNSNANTNTNTNANNYHNNRSSQHNSFNSFSKPPKEPANSFLHDQMRHNYSKYNINSIRHTPKTRLLPENNMNITTRKHRENKHYKTYNNNNRNNNNNYNYNYVEECRMKKLWTDFIGDKEFILSELEFCKDTSFFITSNSIAHKISNIIKLLLNEYCVHNIKFNDKTEINILDGLSCIGGNTYSFGKIFNSLNHKIYANELDIERYNALMHNMKIFSKYNIINDNIEFFNCDFNKLHLTLGKNISNKIDVIFLDPEWNNGDDYKQTNRGQIHLFDVGKYHLYQVIDNIIMEWYTNIKIIAIKLAKNYDQEFIHRKLQKCKLIENKTFRVGQITFHNQKLIIIIKSFNNNNNNNNNNNEDIDIGLSFDQIFNCLPKMVNKNSSASIRDSIIAKILS